MKNMKKLFCILLSLLLLTACGAKDAATEEKNPSLVSVQEQIKMPGNPLGIKNVDGQINASENLIGVAYLGDVSGDFSAVNQYINQQEFSKVYPFIKDIEETHFVQNEGNELYCLVPADESVTVKIHRAKIADDEYALAKGEELMTITDGFPVLIRGNISELMPNLMLVAQKGDVVVEFFPRLSLENGVLMNQEQLVYDFSPYELMARYNGLDPSYEWSFCGNWTSTVTEFNGDVYEMELSLTTDGLIDLSFQSDTVSGSYTGNWLVMSDGRIRMELGGSTQDSEMPGVTGLHTDVDGIYFWKKDGSNLVLTYINGTPFYPSATVQEFRFVPAE